MCGAARVIGSRNSITNLFASFAKSDKLVFKAYTFSVSKIVNYTITYSLGSNLQLTVVVEQHG